MHLWTLMWCRRTFSNVTLRPAAAAAAAAVWFPAVSFVCYPLSMTYTAVCQRGGDVWYSVCVHDNDVLVIRSKFLADILFAYLLHVRRSVAGRWAFVTCDKWYSLVSVCLGLSASNCVADFVYIGIIWYGDVQHWKTTSSVPWTTNCDRQMC